MTRVLLTGASGYLGRYLLRSQPATIELLAICNSQSLQSEHKSFHVLQQDLLKADFSPWQQFAPDVIIHTAAQSRFHACQNDPDLTHEMNVVVSRKIAGFAAENGSHLIFTSTDQVYSGQQALSPETGLTAPKNVYASSKLAAEEGITEILPSATILRCALMYGTSLNDQPVFTDLMALKLKAGESLDLFIDEWRSPLWVADMAGFLWQIVERRPRGIYNTGGPQRLSRYQMGTVMCEVLDIPLRQIRQGKLSQHQLASLRPADCSMDSSKLMLLLGGHVREMRDAFAIDSGRER